MSNIENKIDPTVPILNAMTTQWRELRSMYSFNELMRKDPLVGRFLL